MDWISVTTELEAKLDPSNVKKPSGRFGPKGDYIEGWHAIAEANRIFGFGGWSYTIERLVENSLVEAAKGGKTQWQAAYTCIVCVRVGDVTRQDVGFGSGFAASVGDAIEGATKEAVTDALKRALRTFGNPFGLPLYDKTRANVASDEPVPEPEPKPKPRPEPPFDAAAFTERMTRSLNGARSIPDLQAYWKEVYQTRKRLTDQQFADMTAVKDKRKEHLSAGDMAKQAPPDDETDNGYLYR